jgi:solute carrier family 13 (sodium-dependent dicarboxylate transporter), member 2/3/5
MTKLLAVAGILAGGVLAISFGIDAEPQVIKALCLLWVIAVLWLTESLHTTITALLVPVLAVMLGLLDVADALKQFSNPIIFLFLGGFALAAAMHVQQLDKYLAHQILRLTAGRLNYAIILLCFATMVLSMWISNTATVAVMLPLVLGMLSQRDDLQYGSVAFALLGIAYSANVGGIGTIVGSPPNAIVAAELGMTFRDWLVIGMPVAFLLWPLTLFILAKLLKPDFTGHVVDIKDLDFHWSTERKRLIIIFLITVIGWLFSKPLGKLLAIKSDMDSWVALLAIVMLTASQVVNWKSIEKSTDWGVLLLFGGGLTLSSVLKTTGSSAYMGDVMSSFAGNFATVVVVLIIVAFVVFLTELTSNTATTALLVPIFITLPVTLVSHEQAALAVGISASCAFMLPVATPPNAIVHGTGMLQQHTMMRVGFYLNIMCIALLTTLLTLAY